MVCDEGDVVEAEVVGDTEVAVVDTDIKDGTTAVEVDVEDIEGVVEVVAQEPGLITPSMVMRNYYQRILLMDPPWLEMQKQQPRHSVTKVTPNNMLVFLFILFGIRECEKEFVV